MNLFLIFGLGLYLSLITGTAQNIEETTTTENSTIDDDSHSSHSSSSSSEELELNETTTRLPGAQPTPTTDIPESSSESHESFSTESIENHSVLSEMRVTKRPMTECELLFDKSDSCLRSALFIEQDTVDIPHTEEHMDAYCEVKKRDFLCIREYGATCLKNVPRQIYMSIWKNIRIMFKEFCDTAAGKRTFLKHLECVEPSDLRILKKVLGRLTNALHYVSNNVTTDKMITHACCAVQITYEEIPIEMKDICSPNAVPEATIEFFKSLIKRTVGDILDLGCGRFQSLSYCNSHLHQGMEAMTQYIESTELPKNSFMIPLMDFSHQIDGQ